MTAHDRWLWCGVWLINVGLLVAWQQRWLPMSPWELVGVVSGLICTVLAIQQRILNFPFSILNSLCYLAFFYIGHVYGNMALQVIYIALAVQGWVLWSRRICMTSLPVTHITRRELVVITCIAAAATYGLAVYLTSVADPSPLLDALSTVLAMCGQYLLNRKRVENWIFGGISVLIVIAIALRAPTPYWPTAGLYACYFILCLLGWRTWWRDAHTKTLPANASALR